MFHTIHLSNQSTGTGHGHTSLVIEQPERGLPIITYWGRYLGAHAALADVRKTQTGQVMGAGLDVAEMPSLLPTQAEGWSGPPLVDIRINDMVQFLNLQTVEVQHDGSSAQILSYDNAVGVQVQFNLRVTPSGIIEAFAILTNLGEAEVQVGKLWLTLPVPADCDELLSFTGHHNRERTPQKLPFREGLFAKESWLGRPDFNSGFLMCAGTSGFDYERGEVRGSHVAWSGNVTHFAVRTPYSGGLLGGGELLYSGEIVLGKDEEYITPPVLFGWGVGTNQLSQKFHHYVRAQHSRICPPITLNTWEALYFDQKPQTMFELAHAAAELGVERFVIDDGWFKGRRDDTRALGDWSVDRQVWPAGLAPIASEVHNLGMEFGLWFEPEMVSLDSDLARTHPEWILRPNGHRMPLSGRNQFVLDLTNPQVFEYIFSQISSLIDELDIDFIKWDHNRFVTEAVSPFTGKPVGHFQTRNLYALIDRLRESHPGLQIEACASGGGRVDLGMLSRCSRIWVSDCTDPLERARIQMHTSLLVPPEMMGAHIAQSPSHVTGRHSYLSTRAAVACGGSLGLEWNILQLQSDERNQVADWLSLYKSIRGRLYGDSGESCQMMRTSTADPAVLMSGLAREGWSLWCFAMLDTSEHYPLSPVRMPGLDPNCNYRVRPFGSPELYEKLILPSARSELSWWNKKGAIVPGRILTDWGIRPLQIKPGCAVLIEVKKM
ncbi:MAG: alpha-galactosidase [Actinomycetaceae bacterium]|nr:alpha-galactosidase [Actinomycetaceae bacterium]